jgi:dTDP-4-dehydrorhamnose reductase
VSAAGPRILLTGAAGQLGRELAALLPACGTLIACDRAALDLADAAAVARVVRGTAPQFIVNAGAYTAVDRAETERELAFAINERAPGVLAAEARSLGAVLIHYSTDYVFDGARSVPYDEDAHAAPLNVYGAS